MRPKEVSLFSHCLKLKSFRQMLAKAKQSIRSAVYSIIKPPYAPQSYSQAGEDAILRFLFKDKKIKEIRYLDIGTNVPDYGNNTYLFYKDGSSGVCVDADKTLIPLIKKLRPRDTVINVGIAVSHEKDADFYIFDLNGINTFNKEEAEKRSKTGTHKIKEIVRVPLLSINELIQKNFDSYPHLLSLDIEGLDLVVLKSLDYLKFPIPVICVETCVYSENHIRAKDNSIAEFLSGKGYEIYADTYINTIFVNKKWFYKI